MAKELMRLENFSEEPEESKQFDLNEETLEHLIELVGSEEDVEMAAKASHDDLLKASEAGEIEYQEESVPEKLAIAALIVKLVELGKLGPEDADSFIQEHLD